MVKKLFIASLLLGVFGGGCFYSPLVAQDTMIISGAWPNKNFEADLAIDTPAASASLLTEADRSKAGWVYFWMYDDGVFSRLPELNREFSDERDYNTALKVRGKYTDDPEPPHMPGKVLSGGPTTALPPADSLPQDKDIDIFSNWDAARIGDTIYLALAVRYRDDKFKTRSGQVSLLYPRDAFRYTKEVFPSASNRFGTIDSAIVSTTEIIGNWRLTDVPPFKTQTLFIEMLTTSSARDNTTYPFEIKVDWDDEQTNTTKTNLSTVFGISTSANTDDGSSEAPNAQYFEPEATTQMKVNRSRDPNALAVAPEEVPPAAPAPVHKLEYTVFVENVGTATTPNLQVEVSFDNKINLNSFAFRSLDFKMPVADPVNPCCTGNKAIFNFNGINLPPSAGGANPAGKGSFKFTMDTKPGLTLNNGDKITAEGVIHMVNNSFLEEDVENTGPAIVEVRKPKRLCYGWLLGLKAHSQLPNPDSIGNAGLNLTFQVPLCNPPENKLNSKRLKAPAWWWQFELGLGKSSFYGPPAESKYAAKYIHLTPAQIRYTNIPVGPVHLGLSAGYSACYVFGATRDGQKAPLKSGLGKRLEHELAVSLDAFNMVTVPGIAIGAGYKYRTNNLFQEQEKYGFPFVYAQLNFAHFQKKQVQLLNKIYRW